MVMMTLHGPLRKELRAPGSVESLVTVIFPCHFNPGDLLAGFKSTTGWGWEAFSPPGAGNPANYSGESRRQPASLLCKHLEAAGVDRYSF